MMRTIVTWNVNGVSHKWEAIQNQMSRLNPDYLCLQETRITKAFTTPSIKGYHCYWNNAKKSGYAGTAIICKTAPMSVSFGTKDKPDDDGRIITIEMPSFYLVNTYMPAIYNDADAIARRSSFDAGFRNHLEELCSKKPIIICGDFNIPLTSLDMSSDLNTKQYQSILREGRKHFVELLLMGLVDVWRYSHPRECEYSWIPYGRSSKTSSIGMRLDYCLVSKQLLPGFQNACILRAPRISDHLPVQTTLVEY